MNNQIYSNWFTENRKSTNRIRNLTENLSENELSTVLPNGWSIAVTLAHLAFWDQRIINLIETNKSSDRLEIKIIDDQINDILAPILAVIPPVEAANLCLDTAERVDELLEKSSPTLIDKLAAVNERFVERHLHRSEHIYDIEKFLKIES